MIEVCNYTKIMRRRKVLDNINITFKKGVAYGLYGRNGSGKTMLLKAIAGLIFPTKGEIKIDNKVLHKDISFPPSVGVIIENTSLLPQYNAFTNLKILAKIKNTATEDDIEWALTSVGLDAHDKTLVRAYSLGMKQRLAIAQAIFEKPELLLLDEPTNALDEKSVVAIRELLLDLKENGTTIILASHNKEDLHILADETISIVEGKIDN